MRDPYKWGRVVILGGILGLLAVLVGNAPAAAVDVTGCANFAGSTDSRFDIRNNITTSGGGACLTFPQNAVVYMNGWFISGPGIDTASTGISMAAGEGFLLGPGIVRFFGTCVSAGDHVAIEYILTNRCANGIISGNGYKIKEVRVRDCLPSTFPGTGIRLGQGGFLESSIVRFCDIGLDTGENNKIWDLVVTGHSAVGVAVDGGNAVSRTVVSHPSFAGGVVGMAFNCPPGVGCQEGSNSVSGHVIGNNIQFGTVVTQPAALGARSATNCNGASNAATRDAVTGLRLLVAGC